MERVWVESSNISSVGYDAVSYTLEVEFKSGQVYQYFNVPGAIHEELMMAPSKGAYFSANIRDSFPFARS